MDPDLEFDLSFSAYYYYYTYVSQANSTRIGNASYTVPIKFNYFIIEKEFELPYAY